MAKPGPVAMDVDSDDDPIMASYPVFLNPALPLGRRLLVLQHPNRTDDHPRPPPSELRLKASSGMVEVDMPLDYDSAYDREKGQRWGRTLQSSMTSKNGGSHGLAGGFGFGAVQQRGGRKKSELDDDEAVDWNEAVRQDKVLRTQTLGGQYPDADEVQYMVGVFQGKDLHLTPVSSLVHLRPQLHHIDATTQQERQAASSSSKEPSGGGASGPSSGPAARAIHMTIKTTTDGETVTAETIADRLRFVQSEPWRKMRYTDENEEAAWDVYNDSLFLRTVEDEQPANAEDKAAALTEKTLEDTVPQFRSKWDDDRLLEAVSGIKKPVPAPAEEPEVKAAPAKPEPKGKQPEERPKPKATRTRGGGAAGSTRRGSRSKASGA